MKKVLYLIIALFSLSLQTKASTFNNETGEYTLSSLPSAESEAIRMDRAKLSDQQPSGRYIRKDEIVTILAKGMKDGQSLSANIGFLPMWNIEQTQQEEILTNGVNVFTATQDGPLFFKFISDANHSEKNEVYIKLTAGQPFPLYIDNITDLSSWSIELEKYNHAPFIQFLGNSSMITLPMDVYKKNPIINPKETMSLIEKIIGWDNELAGFDNENERDKITPLRVHYLVDFLASKKDRENFYMYQTDQFIGMQPDNAKELTNPTLLREGWGIWHETGHTYQQQSWTWNSLTEINVNIFSLYIQEKLGRQSRLSIMDDEGNSIIKQAKKYLELGPDDYLVDSEDNVFIKLVMFQQIKDKYGWGIFKNISKYYRENPMDSYASDQQKLDQFVITLCVLTNNDLRRFFKKWGLHASTETNYKIDELNLDEPEHDLN